MTDPIDMTTGRPFLDFPATHSSAELRHLMAEAIALFIETHACAKTTATKTLQQLFEANRPLIAAFEQK